MEGSAIPDEEGRMKARYALFLLLCLSSLVWASPRIEVKHGNQSAQTGNAADALTHYKRALDERGDSTVILYDIGNLMYQQGDYESARRFYGGSARPNATQRELSETLYNLGNSFFESQQYDKALAAYIEALKRNPGDEQAKYNLELARLMLQQQKQQQQQQNQNQQQQQQQDSSQQQEQNQPQQQQQDSTQQQEQQRQPQYDQQMSKEEAERILNALLSDEQNALKDAKKVKAATRAKREKDW
jgi:tetratricopeptide (TPR) repeat protein